MTNDGPSRSRNNFRQVFRGFVFAAGALFAAGFLFTVWLNLRANENWFAVAEERFAAVVGLPLAAFAAMFIVLFLEIKSGPIEFEALGMKFKGASGEVVLFVFVFLSFAGAIKLLW